jgi:hypothetical protein
MAGPNILDARKMVMAKHKNPEWVKLFIEGGWIKSPSGGWFPNLDRVEHGRVQSVKATYEASPAEPYVFTHNGIEIMRGDLTEVLEAADAYLP